MTRPASPLPSLDALLRAPEAELLVAQFGRSATTAALRAELAARRAARDFPVPPASILDTATDALMRRTAAAQRPVFNLTGTVLHTNLGRALLPLEAAQAAAAAMAAATTLEFDLTTGRRGERDAHVASLLCEITGAEAATVVNNNAAAVFLILNTARPWARGSGLARRIDRDRWGVPHPRDHGTRRSTSARGRDHQPHASP